MIKVLFVDDELSKPGNKTMFQKEFFIDGVEYRFAASGNEMFRILESETDIAAIFLDIRFECEGHNHGLELLKKLSDTGVSAPIIMISSLSDASTVIRAWELGAQGYLVKWALNKNFHQELKQKILQFAKPGAPRTEEQIQRQRNRILIRTQKVMKNHAELTEDDHIRQALDFKKSVGGKWLYKPPFPDTFQNYSLGWNETDEVIKSASENNLLLYLNIDFGDGCTLRCPHCFTQEGAIDKRGRDPLPYTKLKESILEAKELGLKCVRILGRGEPTQWIANDKNRSGFQPSKGEDIIDFIKFLHANEITPLIFTRGQILGNNELISRFYGGNHNVYSSKDLFKLINNCGVSLFVGVSSIFPEVNNEMVGRPQTSLYSYDHACRNTLEHAITFGFNKSKPTRLAVEMPIANLNIREMPVRYILFQCLGINPCTNVYMVTGRAMTYGLGDITDPPQEQFIDYYSMVTYFARNMGISLNIGAYAGIKECHDVSFGMYLTLNGDLYPCPGYEGVHNIIGSLRTHSLKTIWKNNLYAGNRQSVCPPKISSHFPPDFELSVEKEIVRNKNRYQETYEHIIAGLGVI
jgi:MoaA/NifB/PqqE/SkfB family radical SAM enzyme/DNA-binding response OmpR family regulator